MNTPELKGAEIKQDVRKQSEIDKASENFESLIEALAAEVGSLEEELLPILKGKEAEKCVAIGSEASATGQPLIEMPAPSSMRNRICDWIKSVNALVRRIEVLRERVDV